MGMLLGDLAQRLGTELFGDPEREVHSAATLDQAGPQQLSFLANRKYREQLATTQAAAVVVAAGDRQEGLNCLVADNPYLAFARAVALLHPRQRPAAGVHAGAHVADDAELGAGAAVLPGAVVGAGARIGAGSVLHPGAVVAAGATVGADCELHANAVVREGCVLGDRVVLQPCAVIGSDGFGYARDGARQVAFPQVGSVVLEDEVEVGACSTIDRAALGETRIGRGTKIDNQVQIAHNVVVGQDCTLVSQVGISGSTSLGDRVVLAGQVGVVGHLNLGSDVIVGAQSGVPSDLPPGSMVTGTPALPHKDFLRVQGVVRRLPEYRRKIQELEKRLAQLESMQGGLCARPDTGKD